MRLLIALLVLPLGLLAADQAVVLDATWDRFSQHTALRYTHLGSRSRIESIGDKPAPYLLVDTARDQRITVERHNSSWRLDPLEPAPRGDTAGGAPGRPARPQPPPGVGPQGPIGARLGPAANNAGAMPPTPGYNSGTPASPGTIGPRGPVGPRSSPGVAAPGQPAVPPMTAMAGMPRRPDLPIPPDSVGLRSGGGPVGAGMPAMSETGIGSGFGAGTPMAPFSAMDSREHEPTLTKTEETQTLLGRTVVKYTLSDRMLETVEIWAVPDTDFGAFFAYRPQPPHRFGPVDLQDEWDALLRREHLFPLLAIFKQAEREIARFAVAKIEQADIAEPATFFAPPARYYRSPPDPF